MSVVDVTFKDGTKAHLDVSASWWSWLWGGFIFQPINGEVSVVKSVKKSVTHWCPGWLPWHWFDSCTSEENVDDPHSVDQILIEAKMFSRSGDKLSQVTDQGSDKCNQCSDLTHTVQLFGFPHPALNQGVGFRATVSYKEEIKI